MQYAFADEPPILPRGRQRRGAGGRTSQSRGGAPKPQQQAHYGSGHAGAAAGGAHHRNNNYRNNHQRDDGSVGANSLEYSATSSVLSSDNSNGDCFDQFVKDFDNELEREFAGTPEGAARNSAVEGWKQRLEGRQRAAAVAQQQQQQQQQQRQQVFRRSPPQVQQPGQESVTGQSAARPQFAMASSSQDVPTNPNVQFQYSHSRENSSDGSDVFGEDFFDESLFDTISR